MYYIQNDIVAGLHISGMSIMDILDRANTKEYNDFIIEYIIRDLENTLGDNTLQAINLYLRRYNLTLSDICNEPDEIRNAFYNMFGNGAYRLEQEVIKSIYNLLKFDITPVSNIAHAIKLSRVYFKVHSSNEHFSNDILELINIEEPKYCKACDNRLDPRNCTYDGLLSELCYNCYNMQNEMVISIMNETL